MSDDEMWEVLAPTIKWWLLVSILGLLSVLFHKTEVSSSNPVKEHVLTRQVVEESANRSKKVGGNDSSAEAIVMMKREALQNLEMAERLLQGNSD